MTGLACSSVKCARGCGEWLVFTPDAIGRLRGRCPKCDGTAPVKLPRPGEVRRSQLVKLGEPIARVTSPVIHTAGGTYVPAGQYLLPPIEPGQRRCQVCARPVKKPSHRLCRTCVVEGMKAAAALRWKPKAPRRCACGAELLFRRHKCDACLLHPTWRERKYTECKCGAPLPKRVGKAGKPPIRCAACEALPREQRPRPLRPSRAAKIPRVPGTPRIYHERPCLRCRQLFMPTGPRSIFCKRAECRG